MESTNLEYYSTFFRTPIVFLPLFLYFAKRYDALFSSEEVMIALWANHATEFDADHYMEMATHNPVVFLFVGFTCKEFNSKSSMLIYLLYLHVNMFCIYDPAFLLHLEKLSLQGSSLCKWYANPELPEVAALQDRYTYDKKITRVRLNWTNNYIYNCYYSCAGQVPPATWYGPRSSHLAPEKITIADLSKFDNPHIIYVSPQSYYCACMNTYKTSIDK